MPSHVFKIESGKFALSTTDPAVTDACAATATAFTEFTCQITAGALNASPNVSDETIPATWCEPESTVPSVGATSYELALTFLQDPDVVQGLSRWLFEHDTERAWFYMGLDGDNPPKAVGQIRVVAGAIGGEARVALTADVTLPVDGKPIVCFGNETDSESVGGGTVAATGATAGTPGSFTPAGSTPPADTAALIASSITASPNTAWTTGQYVQTATAGTTGRGYWNGTAWVAGTAP